MDYASLTPLPIETLRQDVIIKKVYCGRKVIIYYHLFHGYSVRYHNILNSNMIKT